MQSRSNSRSLRLLIACALLAAIGIILGKFLAFNVTEFMRFSLENLPIFIASAAFGPLVGAAVGVVEDVVGCLCVGYMLNPLITLGAAVNGLVFGLIYKALGGRSEPVRMSVSVIVAHLLGSVLVKTIGLSVYYSLPFTATLLWRLVNYILVGAIEVILLCYLFKSKVFSSNIQKIKQDLKLKKEDESSEL